MTHAAHIDDFVPCRSCGDCLTCDPHTHGNPTITPASDEAIEDLKAGMRTQRWRGINDVVIYMTAQTLIARIEQDRAAIKAQHEEIAKLREEKTDGDAAIIAEAGWLADLAAEKAARALAELWVQNSIGYIQTFSPRSGYLDVLEERGRAILARKGESRG